MFNIFSWQHIIILVVIALVVVGPKDLPRLMRMAAKWVRKGKSVANGLRQNLDDLTRTAELDGLRAEMNALKKKHPLSSLERAVSPADPAPPRG
ncbi:MAG TPA: Sec-independent protein translocase protein TatB [Rhizomicrobium sp.]|nr:Sec-independent protein translocase protein TatB [Rhizomicrobium sp.]